LRILLVEDDPDLSRQLKLALADAGYAVDHAADGEEAQYLGENEPYDAIILDLGLPGMNGHEFLRRLRGRDDRCPVLVLTARDAMSERIGSLHEGADDFMQKPFAIEELEARLHALIRRSRGRGHPRWMLGDLVLDIGGQRFLHRDTPLALSPREYAALKVLIQKAGEPVTKQQILDRISPEDTSINPEAVEVLIHRLRKKLADTGAQIVTLRGMGYCLEPVRHAPD
jgi:two-component system response regulator TctD